MGESTKSWLSKYWPLLVQLAVWTFFSGMAWNAFQQTREDQKVMGARIEKIESSIHEGEKTDSVRSEDLAKLGVEVRILISEVQLLRRRLEDKKIVFQSGSDNSGVVGGKYNERP
jgi:hypothetical protein